MGELLANNILSELDFYPYDAEEKVVLRHEGLLISWFNITAATNITTTLGDNEDLVSKGNSKTFYHKIEENYPAGRFIDNRGDGNSPEIDHLVWHFDKCLILSGQIKSELRLNITAAAPCIIAFNITLVNIDKLTLSTDNLLSIEKDLIVYEDNPNGNLLLSGIGLKSTPIEMLHTKGSNLFVSGINFIKHAYFENRIVSMIQKGSLFCTDLYLNATSSVYLNSNIQSDDNVFVESYSIFQNITLVAKGVVTYKASQIELYNCSELLTSGLNIGSGSVSLIASNLDIEGKILTQNLDIKSSNYVFFHRSSYLMTNLEF